MSYELEKEQTIEFKKNESEKTADETDCRSGHCYSSRNMFDFLFYRRIS